MTLMGKAMPTTCSCPSSQPDQPGASVIGVLAQEKDSDTARVRLLPVAVPANQLIDLVVAPVRPTEVLRFASPCVGDACKHFDEGKCQLARRIVAELPEVTETLRPCAIRSSCRWFQQERAAACRRCPQVITEPYAASELMQQVATPVEKGSTQ